MFIDFLWHAFRQNQEREAVIWQDRAYTYGWLLAQIAAWQETIKSQGIPPGAVVVLEGNYSPQAIALFLALVEQGCIVVPLASLAEAAKPRLLEIAQAEMRFALNAADEAQMERLPGTAVHPLYAQLRHTRHPGLVLFSSGSTGDHKAIVHDLLPMLQKYQTPGKRFRTIAFMLYDHIGGLNTMLYTLANTGCMVAPPDRSPDCILQAIEKYRVDLLPTSPTFINLLLLSEAYKKYDLSSLHLITYGTEPMPESTLQRIHALLPTIELRQTYGLSEVGILRSKSRSSDSLWVKVGGEQFQTRVVDGILHIRARSAMLGYLNAPAPFTDDGWLITGDRVEVDGDYVRLLGRDSEIINVGGEKVYPIEVESVIQEIENVQEVTVYGEKNPITGHVVCARVRLHAHGDLDYRQFASTVKRYCRERLQSYKVPVKITISDEVQHSTRLKKMRKGLS